MSYTPNNNGNAASGSSQQSSGNVNVVAGFLAGTSLAAVAGYALLGWKGAAIAATAGATVGGGIGNLLRLATLAAQGRLTDTEITRRIWTRTPQP